ncbi:MAG: ABC transporter ATP-binding protein, partial [Bacteroidetes bacterium]|nr:ABC transporter ATP-binding protein [Bacteroidota bacterium]
MAKRKTVIGKAVDLLVLKRIFAYVKPYQKNFMLAFTTTIVLAFLSPIRPILIQHTFDRYVATPNPSMLLVMTMILVGLLISEAVMQFADSYLTNSLGQKVIKDIRVQLYKHIIGLRLKYYDNTPIGTLVTRAVSDIEVVANIFSDGIIVIIGDILKITVIVVVMFFMNYKLTFIALTTIPVLLIATYIFKKSVQHSFQDVRTQVARLNAFVQEHITGMNIIQIFNREKAELKNFEGINTLHRDAHIRSIMAYSIFFPVVEILASLA